MGSELDACKPECMWDMSQERYPIFRHTHITGLEEMLLGSCDIFMAMGVAGYSTACKS